MWTKKKKKKNEIQPVWVWNFYKRMERRSYYVKAGSISSLRVAAEMTKWRQKNALKWKWENCSFCAHTINVHTLNMVSFYLLFHMYGNRGEEKRLAFISLHINDSGCHCSAGSLDFVFAVLFHCSDANACVGCTIHMSKVIKAFLTQCITWQINCLC